MGKNKLWPAAIPLVAVWSIAVATSADTYFSLVDAQSTQAQLIGASAGESDSGGALTLPVPGAVAAADEQPVAAALERAESLPGTD
jgi:hypothetical protein